MANIEKRKSKNGTISYRAKVRIKGFPSQSATFDRKSDAKEWSQSIEASMREGRYFKNRESKKHTLSEIIDRYIEEIMPLKPKSMVSQTIQLLWWKKTIGGYLICDITPSLISKTRDDLYKEKTTRGDKKKSSTVNRYLAVLSHLFTIALKEWQLVDHNPVSKITKHKESGGKTRFLSDDERKRLLEACQNSKNKHLLTIVTLCLSTGARKMEIVGLKWSAVDFYKATITLHYTKNGDIRVLPLVGYAFKLMEKCELNKRIDCDWVFPNKKLTNYVDIRLAWEKALKEANIKNFRFHDLRHSAASYLAMNGASLAEISAILGHKTLSMVKRYSHFSESHTSEVIKKMNDKIFS